MREALNVEEVLAEVDLRLERADLSARSSGPVGSPQDLTEWGIVCELRYHVLHLKAQRDGLKSELKEACDIAAEDHLARAAAETRAEELRAALALILPLAKGYAPDGQTPTARATCRSWIEAAEAALAATSCAAHEFSGEDTDGDTICVFCGTKDLAGKSFRPASPDRESIARVIWDRFAPCHSIEFGDDGNRSEYLQAADAILALPAASSL